MATASVQTRQVDYREGETRLRGYFAYPEADGPRPAVIVVHAWNGPGEYVERRARELAELGYVGFAADIYGADANPTSPEERMRLVGSFREDRHLTRARIRAAVDAVRADPRVDGDRIGAIGYCFGGMVVLELARSGADVRGVVVFHGTLETPTPEDARNIRAKVLALQGGDDPHIGIEQTGRFIEEMRGAGVDWELVLYGGAVHSYTEPAAGSDPTRGVAYDAQADRRSWKAMQDFLEEVFS